MKKFIPYSEKGLYTKDFMRDPLLQINRIVLVGYFEYDMHQTDFNAEVFINYAEIGSSIESNVASEIININYGTEPIEQQLVEIDITTLINSNVNMNDFFTISIKGVPFIRQSLLCFELV